MSNNDKPPWTIDNDLPVETGQPLYIVDALPKDCTLTIFIGVDGIAHIRVEKKTQ